jgi:hypothetical protein
VISLISHVFLSLLLVFGQASSPQPSDPPPQRDAQAISAISTALTAFGGQSAAANISTAVFLGTLVSTSPSSNNNGSFRWESDFGGPTYEFRNEMVIGGTTKIFTTGHGRPVFYNGVKMRSLFSHVAYASVPYHLPAMVLLRSLNDPNCSLTFLGTIVINDTAAVHVRSQVNTGPVETELSVTDWYFASATGLPLRVEYRTPSTVDMKEHLNAFTVFSNYQITAGIYVPLTLISGDSLSPDRSTATITSVTFNSPIPSTDFDLAAGGGL